MVLPVRNGETYVELAVSSIISQTFQKWELIAIDDGSVDATLSILQRLAATEPRVRILATGGAGIVEALNQGILASNADLIARMDADDIALPDRLARQVNFMKENPSIVAAGGPAVKIDKAGNETGRIVVPTDASAIAEEMRWRNPFIHPTMILRKALVRQVGMYRNGCTYAEDYDLWLRLEETGALANLVEPTLLFRVHADQTSKTKRLQQRAATALARQSALRRRSGKGEGANMACALNQSCADFLLMRTGDETKITEVEAKDLSLILRFVCERLAWQTVQTLLERIQLEGKYKKSWLLRLRLTASRLLSLFNSMSATVGKRY